MENNTETLARGAPPETALRRIREKDFCYYCESHVLNFSRHIIRNHPLETEVQKILSKPCNSKERKSLIACIRKKGNYLQNSEQCLKPVRKPALPTTNDCYLPCIYCLGFYKNKQLWRHRKKCSENPENGKCSTLADAQNVLIRHLRIDHQLKEKVFPRMRADQISFVAKKDFLICGFGARYLKIHRENHFINVVSRKMRELAKLLIAIRKINPNIKNLFNSLRPQNFDVIVEAVKSVAQYNKETNFYASPTYAINIGTTLKQCCDIAITYALTGKEKFSDLSFNPAEAEANFKTMIHLLTSNWRYEISSQAADDLNVNKWNKITIIPLASDLKLLKEWLQVNANKAAGALQNDNTSETAFNNLLETIYCQLILLNRRRPGELQRLLLRVYEKSNIAGEQYYEEFDSAISPTEKILLQRFKRIVIKGKRNRGVPVLFSTDVQNHIYVLLKFRSNFIGKENPYLFAKSKSNNPIDGYKVLQKFAKACGAKNPKAISSTRLRKHLATITQIFNMTENDIEQLALFMGHTTGVHKKSYRLPDDVYQTAKISKLLMLMENGTSTEFKGMCLDDINVNLDEDLLEGMCLDDRNVNLDDDLLKPHENTSESIDFHGDIENSNFVNFDTNQSAVHTDHSPFGGRATSTNLAALARKNRRLLVPWTDEQKNIVKTFFKKHISKSIAPKRAECNDLIHKYPSVFVNKSWLKIKVFVQNQYRKK